jgi:hypothetical protein
VVRRREDGRVAVLRRGQLKSFREQGRSDRMQRWQRQRGMAEVREVGQPRLKKDKRL